MLPTAGQATLEKELVIISPNAKGILDSYKAAFEKYCSDVLKTPVTLTYSYYASEDCYKLAKEWGGKPKADIWWGGGVDLFQTATRENLLLQYKCKDWAKIPSDLYGIPAKDTNGFWTGCVVSGFGLAIHLDYLKRYNLAEPKSWKDLLNPIYRGHIVMCTPTRSGSTHMMAEIVLQGMGADPGWAYFRQMAANVALFTSRSGDVINDINKGEHGIGLVVDYYGFESAVAGLPVKLVYPSDYSLANPDSIAILAGAPHPEAAKAFLDYLMSEEGQKLGMGVEQRGVKCPSPRLPIRADLTIPPYLPDITKMKMITYNATLSNARWGNVNTIFETTIEKKHAELKDAWNTIEAAQKAIDGTNTSMSTMEKEGYDVTKVKTELAKAKDLVTAAQKSFDTGDYAAAKTSAGKASDTAKASIGLAEKPPPYATYAGVAVVVLVLVAALYMYYSKKKKTK
jgi:iron(III) transport system substrate-binding protein